MPSKKRGRRSPQQSRILGVGVKDTTQGPTKVSEAQQTAAQIARIPLLIQDLYAAEMRAQSAERHLHELRDKLTGLLSPDQVEHAQIAGCDPALYAIECINMFKAKIFPALPKEICPLYDLTYGQPKIGGQS